MNEKSTIKTKSKRGKAIFKTYYFIKISIINTTNVFTNKN